MNPKFVSAAEHMRATLKDIAERAGIHKSTVSRALRNHPDVDEGLRKRVQKIADQIGYYPDLCLARIASARWRRPLEGFRAMVAFIFEESELRPIDNAHLSGIRDRSKRLGGYKVEPMSFRDFKDAPHLHRVLFNRGCEGLILGQFFDGSVWEGFDWKHFSVVACGSGGHYLPVPSISVDFLRPTSQAVRLCRKQSLSRIGFLFFDEPDIIDTPLREGSVWFEMAHKGGHESFDLLRLPKFPVSANWEQTLDPKLRSSRIALIRRWVARLRPQVVVGLNDGMYWWLRMAGFEMPRDMRFISLDSGVDSSNIAGFCSVDSAVGELSLSLLDTRLRLSERGLQGSRSMILIEPEWKAGLSFPAS